MRRSKKRRLKNGLEIQIFESKFYLFAPHRYKGEVWEYIKPNQKSRVIAVVSGDRLEIPGLLRLAIARYLDPAIDETHKKLNPNETAFIFRNPVKEQK